VKRLTHPATIIAALALFVALAGGAYASGLINGSQIKNHTISAKKLTKSAVKSLHGQRGPAGPKGAQGVQGVQGVKGDTGPAGTFSGTLPSGKTLRGVFLAEGESSGAGNSTIGDNISFGWSLTAAPTGHFIKVGDSDPAGCSGTATNPGAAPGNLCVFEVENSNVNDGASEVWSPPADSAGATEAYGAAVFSESAGAGSYEFGGSWAVTAP
jgi:hypothetical protein